MQGALRLASRAALQQGRRPSAAARGWRCCAATAPGRFGRLSFVGGGKMSEAMITGVLANKLVEPSAIIASDPNPKRREHLESKLRIQTTNCNLTSVDGADIVVFANKPQHCGPVFQEVRGKINPESLVISICAGVMARAFQEGLGHDRVVRTMPNTTAMVQSAMTVWFATDAVSEAQLSRSKALLGSFGKEERVTDEDYLDMATALSGSGPAYFFLLMESLVDAGVHMGFPRDVADRLVRQTALGSALYANEAGGIHPTILRNDITSPGGTTAAALYAADRGNFRNVVTDAVWSAFERSKALNISTDLKDNKRS